MLRIYSHDELSPVTFHVFYLLTNHWSECTFSFKTANCLVLRIDFILGRGSSGV